MRTGYEIECEQEMMMMILYEERRQYDRNEDSMTGTKTA